MIKAWRMRHLPTGLFYIPSRRIRNPKHISGQGYIEGNHYMYFSNLSKTGKIYPRKPSLAHLLGTFYHEGEILAVVPSEWSIEEIQ